MGAGSEERFDQLGGRLELDWGGRCAPHERGEDGLESAEHFVIAKSEIEIESPHFCAEVNSIELSRADTRGTVQEVIMRYS